MQNRSRYILREANFTVITYDTCVSYYNFLPSSGVFCADSDVYTEADVSKTSFYLCMQVRAVLIMDTRRFSPFRINQIYVHFLKHCLRHKLQVWSTNILGRYFNHLNLKILTFLIEIFSNTCFEKWYKFLVFEDE